MFIHRQPCRRMHDRACLLLIHWNTRHLNHAFVSKLDMSDHMLDGSISNISNVLGQGLNFDPHPPPLTSICRLPCFFLDDPSIKAFVDRGARVAIRGLLLFFWTLRCCPLTLLDRPVEGRGVILGDPLQPETCQGMWNIGHPSQCHRHRPSDFPVITPFAMIFMVYLRSLSFIFLHFPSCFFPYFP